MKKIIILLVLLLCVVGCDENTNVENENPDALSDANDSQEGELIEGTFINASQKARGEFGASSIELKKDGQFSYTDIVGMGATLIEGTYGRQGNVLMFCFDEALYDIHGDKIYNFELRYVDKDTLEMMRDLQGSLAGDCFSKSGEIPKDFVAVYQPAEVACTGLKAKSTFFWAIANPINTYNLGVVVEPENCNEKVNYTSDDESIASVDEEGTVTPGKVGKTTIHVTCGNQKLDIPIESRAKTIDLEKIELEDITLSVNEETTISVKFYPEDTTDKTLTFKSADSTRISVNTDGKIIALKPGPCDIYVTASNGETYTCHIMVEGEFLDIDLPLYSEISYSQGTYAPCRVFVHGYKDGLEYTNDVWHEASLHSEGGEVNIVGDMLFANSDPGKEIETDVWFTYNGMSTIKVTIYVEP